MTRTSIENKCICEKTFKTKQALIGHKRWCPGVRVAEKTSVTVPNTPAVGYSIDDVDDMTSTVRYTQKQIEHLIYMDLERRDIQRAGPVRFVGEVAIVEIRVRPTTNNAAETHAIDVEAFAANARVAE